MLRKSLFLVLLILLPIVMSAQTLSEIWVTSDTLQVYFQQSKSKFDPLFRENGENLRRFTEEFHKMKETEGSMVMSVLIVSGASPEGNLSLNRRLSDERAQTILDYFLEEKLLDPSEVEVESRGVDWKGLYTIMEYSDLPYREDVISILSGPETDTIMGIPIELRQRALKRLNKGKVWDELLEDYFPNLRGTMVMIVWNIKREIVLPEAIKASENVIRPDLEAPTDTVTKIKVEPKPVPVFEPEPEWSFNMVLKTNLLYDGMLIPNLGVEFGIWKGLVLDVNYMHNIWLRVDYSYWYRVHGAEFGLKYYFNKDGRPYQGHHIGAYAQMLTFDITGILVDAEPWKFGPMLTYGYALPITERLNLDFEVGLGLLIGDVYKYDAVDHKRLLREIEDFAFVPKAGVTLQYLIGKNNYNENKK